MSPNALLIFPSLLQLQNLVFQCHSRAINRHHFLHENLSGLYDFGILEPELCVLVFFQLQNVVLGVQIVRQLIFQLRHVIQIG
jgi:hypothetical protein